MADKEENINNENTIKRNETDGNPVRELKFLFRNDIENMELKNLVIESYKTHRTVKEISKLVELIKNDLDAHLNTGWIVFAGKDMAGACSFIETTLIEFEVEGLSFVIFQTYCPQSN